jgi:hypothetical protein
MRSVQPSSHAAAGTTLAARHARATLLRPSPAPGAVALSRCAPYAGRMLLPCCGTTASRIRQSATLFVMQPPMCPASSSGRRSASAWETRPHPSRPSLVAKARDRGRHAAVCMTQRRAAAKAIDLGGGRVVVSSSRRTESDEFGGREEEDAPWAQYAAVCTTQPRAAAKAMNLGEGEVLVSLSRRAEAHRVGRA